MVYPNQRRRIEQEYGESFETLLPRLANELGSLTAVAERWNVTLVTVSKWADEIGLVREIRFVVKKPHKSPALLGAAKPSHRK